MSGERIQKALATAGVASRREIERLIAEGRITVNGRPAEVGQKVGPDDLIRVDNRAVAVQDEAETPRVLLYKKRTGEIVTRDDPEGRRTVFRKLPKLASGRWIAVGRLDLNTSGLLLFTNHGELARRLTHPSFEIPRVYAVRVLGTVDADVIGRLTSGVELEDGVGRFVRMEPGENEDGEGANQWYRVVVREGRNRFVRRMIESQDLQVSRLIRTDYGPLSLGRGIKSGTAREATPQELAALLDAVGLEDESRQPTRRGRGRPQRPPGRTPVSKERERPVRASRDDERAVQGGRDRNGRDADRDVRPARDERGGRPAREARGARPAREERGSGRHARDDRSTRPARDDRGGARPARDERGATADRSRGAARRPDSRAPATGPRSSSRKGSAPARGPRR